VDAMVLVQLIIKDLKTTLISQTNLLSRGCVIEAEGLQLLLTECEETNLSSSIRIRAAMEMVTAFKIQASQFTGKYPLRN